MPNLVNVGALALGIVCVSPGVSDAQQQPSDSALLRRLANEAVVAVSPRSLVDTVAQSVLMRAASSQVALNDLIGALKTAAILYQMPGSKTTFDKMSRATICYLLEDRDLRQARRAAMNLASLDLGGEWTWAHFAVQLNRLPRAARKSLKTLAMDSAALTAESMRIAASLTNPKVATDTYLAIAKATRSRDSTTTIHALRSADSARRLVRNRDFTESRQAMIALQALRIDDSLATRLAVTLSNPRDIHWLAVWMARSKRSSTATDAGREALIEKTVRRSVQLAALNADPRVREEIRQELRGMMQYSDRKTLADALVPEDSSATKHAADTTDTLMAHATAALERGDMKDVERWISSMSDPFHVGRRAFAWEKLARETHGNLQLARSLRQRAVTTLADERPGIPERDNLLAYIAQIRLMDGYNEEAVDIVNRIDDPKEARFAIREIGQSTLAHLDPPKLRKLADQLRFREVRDQVLYRLMISMLLVRNATPQQAEWGLALVDSIRTRDLQLKARIEAGRFLKSKGDSVASRTILLSVLRNGFDELERYDRDTLLALLSSLGADRELVKWARSQPSLKHAQALVAILPFLQLNLPHSGDQREMWFSNGPDSCRDEF